MCLFPLSAVGRCLRQPRHTPLIILPLNTQPLAAYLYVCVRICPSMHKWSTQAQSSTSEDQNEAGRRFECRDETVVGRAAHVLQDWHKVA